MKSDEILEELSNEMHICQDLISKLKKIIKQTDKTVFMDNEEKVDHKNIVNNEINSLKEYIYKIRGTIDFLWQVRKRPWNFDDDFIRKTWTTRNACTALQLPIAHIVIQEYFRYKERQLVHKNRGVNYLYD